MFASRDELLPTVRHLELLSACRLDLFDLSVATPAYLPQLDRQAVFVLSPAGRPGEQGFAQRMERGVRMSSEW